jgi:hypothetical protein
MGIAITRSCQALLVMPEILRSSHIDLLRMMLGIWQLVGQSGKVSVHCVTGAVARQST